MGDILAHTECFPLEGEIYLLYVVARAVVMHSVCVIENTHPGRSVDSRRPIIRTVTVIFRVNKRCQGVHVSYRSVIYASNADHPRCSLTTSSGK